MRVCKNPKCGTKLGRWSPTDGLCRDCRGPKGAKQRAAQKKRRSAAKPNKICTCGVEISYRSISGKCQTCKLPATTFPCVNPYCKTRVAKKDRFCRSCFLSVKLDHIKGIHAGWRGLSKEK